MAPRRNTDEDDEIFTDLAGNPDNGGDADDVLLTTDSKGSKKDAEENGDDDDLAIVDEADGAEGDEGGDDEDGEEAGESGEGDAEEQAAAEDDSEPEILFNPADVQLIISESEKLELREATAKEKVETAKRDVADAQAAMEKAMEDGETKAHSAAMNKFADAKIALQTANNTLEQITATKGELATRARAAIAKAPKNEKGEAIIDKIVFKPRAGKAAAGQGQKGSGSKLLNKFLEQNPWFSDAKFAGKKAVLMGLDADLAAEKKLDKNSPEYFAELGRRFNKVHPGLYKNLDGKLLATGERKRGAGPGIPGGGGGGGGGAQNDNQPAGKIRLTSEDVKQMRIFGLDPNSKEVRRNWLDEKIRAAKAEKRGRAA